jgi:putative ABC transport system ATP-binding protein
MAARETDVKIVCDDLIKIYKRGKIEVVALRGLNCNFHRGEITVIMGPSGCGKTTLLNMIGGLDRVNSGKIIVDGVDIAQLTDRELERYRRDKIGFLFQFLNLIPELTGEENITLPLELAGNLSKEKREFARELLRIVGLEDRSTHRPDELSGGEQQRIALAAALSNDPEIILCDEPTGELDSASKKVIMDLLRSIMDRFPNKSMIIVSHDSDLKMIADNMLYIRDGAISHRFSKEELHALQETDGEVTEGGVRTYRPTSEAEASQRALVELRELNHIIAEKIMNIEKKIHPV